MKMDRPLSDINAAKDNGLVAIGCNFDFARDDELSQADIVIDDLIGAKNNSITVKKIGVQLMQTDS